MTTRTLLLLSCLLLGGLSLLAADWPQWGGPDRTGVSKETGLLAQWPEKGPPLLWTFDKTGLGFSGPAVVGNHLYIMGARDGETFLFALDVAKGAEVWACKIGPIFTFQGNGWGDGPRSTAAVDGPFVYALDGFGDLICVKADKGDLVWKKNLEKDLGGEMMSEWGYTASVLIDGDKLICTPGGAKGAAAALDKKTGDVLWRSTELTEMATYASPMIAEIDGVRQYVVVTFHKQSAEGGTISGVAARDGKLLWSFPYFQGSSYSVIPTPIIKGDEIYITEGEGPDRCRLLKISREGGKFKAKNLYERTATKSMRGYHGGQVLVGGHVYGHTEKQGWVCQNWQTGKQAWIERGEKLPGVSGSLIAANGQLYLYSDSGVAVLLDANPKSWEEHGRFEIPKKSTVRETNSNFKRSGIWTHPVVANGMLYLRDQEYLFCYDIRAKK